jgi:Dolichyl-phosphate-mannose-protein mannosyltransferase
VLARTSRWIDVLFATRWRPPIVCFVCALVVFGVESIAWPLAYGRDGSTYLIYYADMWHRHPAFPALMLYRMPLAPLVYGPLLQLGGPLLAEAAMALAYAASILAFATAALEFGRVAAVVTGLALLVHPGYGALFHELSSDPVFGLVFAFWTLALVRALRRPSTRQFLLAGVLYFLLVLSRPGSQVLLVFALAPLVLRAPWRRRLVWAGASLAASVALLALWSGYNDVRYGSFVVARAGWANVPFYRVFYLDKLVRTENGPASRELAAAVQRDLLTKTPYRQLGVKTPDQYFSIASDHMWSDVVWITDREWGWHSDYAILRRVSLEGIRTHFHRYARSVAAGVWDELRYPYVWNAPQAAPPPGTTTTQAPAAPPKPVPKSSPDYGGRYSWLASTPSGRPPVPSRVARVTRKLAALDHDIPERSGSATFARVLNRISRLYPWAIIWIVVGLVALIVRRPRGSLVLLTLGTLGLWLIVFTELGEPPGLEYGLPVVPAFIMGAVAALFGVRGEQRVGLRLPRPLPARLFARGRSQPPA